MKQRVTGAPTGSERPIAKLPVTELPATCVLVVDDAPPDLALIVAMLRQNRGADIGCRTARSLEEATVALASAKFDCVLLDLHLPDGDGIDVVRRLIGAAPDTAVVVLTGLNDSEVAAGALALGAQDFLAKNLIDTDSLCRAIRYAVERHRTQRALLLSELRQRNTLDAVGEGIILFDVLPDRSVRPVLANPAAEAILAAPGEMPDPLLLAGGGAPILDEQGCPIAPADLPVLRVARTGEPAEREVLGLVRDGGTLWIRTTSRPVHSDRSHLTGIVTSMADITTERTAARHLAEAFARFAAMVERNADPILLYDRLGILRYASPALGRTLHDDPDRYLGRPIADLVHPDDRARLLEVFQEQLANPGAVVDFECRLGRSDGTWRNIEVTQTNMLEDPAVRGIVANFRDVTERIEIANRLTHQAMHDVLTQLPNRALMLERLAGALVRAERQHRRCALLYLDLDNFKTVNDSLGHAAGDVVLVTMAERLKAATRPEDTVARLGGDEFVVLIEDVDDQETLLVVAERVRTSVLEPVRIHDHEVTVGASIGIAMGSTHHPEDLLQEADTALYRAKRSGRNRWEIYNQTMRSVARQRLETENRLRRAIDQGAVVTLYQPIVRLATGRTAGVEALARLRDESGGLVGADGFIPIAEESGLIVPLGLQVLDDACRAAASWTPSSGMADSYVSVNVAARQLSDPGFPRQVAEVLAGAGLPSSRLCLELTESTLIDAGSSMRRTVDALHEMGITIAIDDFGTGWSSLAYLRLFPVDVVKIDRSFVAGLTLLPEDAEVVRAVVGLGHALGLTVVAEGVEEEAQAEALVELGCDFAQGYLYGRPAVDQAVSG